MSKNLMLGLGVFGLLLAGFVSITRGQTQERPASLESRVEKLETLVRDLSARVEKLEKGLRFSKAIPPEKRAWRQLRQGMVADEVRELLGEPKSVSVISGTTWRYEPGLVFFNTQTMKVTGWSEP